MAGLLVPRWPADNGALKWEAPVVAGVLCTPRLQQLWLLSAVLEVGGLPQQNDYATA